MKALTFNGFNHKNFCEIIIVIVIPNKNAHHANSFYDLQRMCLEK